jgi:dihydrofolate synthase / folylpolyglutamate synthase
MTYEDAQDYINNTLRFGSKPGLERIGKLLELMGNPQDSLKFIHIAGTNGKGSIANAIAAALSQSGVKTGLYISPFVTDFCERIQIDGCKISHDELAGEVESIASFVAKAGETGEQPTEFEIITALAFNYFKRQGCGVVVLEVGLGGRFDATNIINRPLLSVITSISLDHTDILGDTIEKIAFEKCGIIKNFGVTVTCPSQDTQALEVIMRICSERENTLIMPSLSSVKIGKEGIDGTDIAYGGSLLHIPLAGRHQIANFITAVEAVKAVSKQGITVSDQDIIKGMAKVSFPARMEILNRSPLVLLDGAHNPSGAATLAASIKRYLEEKPVLVMGMLADKDYETAIATLAPLAKAFVAVKPDSPRALEPYKTAQAARKYCENVSHCDDYEKAFLNALKISQGAPVIICGSLFLAGGMRKVVLRYYNHIS